MREIDLELRLSTDRQERTTRLLWILLSIPVVGFSAVIWFASTGLPLTGGWLTFRLGTVVFFAAAVALAGRKILSQVRSVQVALSGDTLVGNRPSGTTTIRRDEVTRIVEAPHGLEIHAEAPRRTINAVPHLEGYEALRAAMATWRPFEPAPPLVERMARDPVWFVAAAWVALRFGVPRLDQPTLSTVALVALIAILALTVGWYRRTGDQTENGQLNQWLAVGLLAEAGFELWERLGS